MQKISLEFDTYQSFSKVHATLYEPKTVVRTLVFVHDLYEHRMRYHSLVTFLTDLGVAVLTYDLRGYRNSLLNHREGFLGNRQDLYRDLEQMVNFMNQRFEGLDTLVMGVGFGALLAMNHLKRLPQSVDRLILVSPVVSPRFRSLKALTFKVLGWRSPETYSTGLWPAHLSLLKNGQRYGKWAYLSPDEKTLMSYHLDPLCGRPLYYSSMFEVLQVIRESYLDVQQQVPVDKRVLLIGGKDDPLTNHGLGLINLKQQLVRWGLHVDDVMMFVHQGHDVLSSLADNDVLKSNLQNFILS